MAENYDGYINIGTKVNTDGIKEGVKDVTSEVKKTGSKANLAALGNLGAAVTGIGTAFSAASGLIKTANAAIKNTTELYKNQVRAEKQLETAAKNNPYLNTESVSSLKNYAAQLQSISTFGDEQLLPQMAELAAAGRTESEIMDIMAASVDAAASGSISLDSAVQSLNLSYSGQLGQLGKILPSLKSFTAQELASGAAVAAVKKNYAGMAETIAGSIGTSEQLANAWGDLKEEIGAPFEKGMAPMRRFFTNLVSGWADALKKKREYEESKAKVENGTANTNDLQIQLDAENQRLEVMKKQNDEAKKLLDLSDKELKKTAEYDNFVTWYDTEGEGIFGFRKALEGSVKSYEAEVKVVDELNKKLKDQAAAEKAAAAAQQAANNQTTAEKALSTYNATIVAKQKEIELRRKAGEEITKEAEEAEMANTMLQAYNQLIKDANGTIKGTSAREQSALNEMGLLNSLSGIEKEMTAGQALDNQMATLEKYYQAVQNSDYITAEKKKQYEEEYTQKHDQLLKQREELDKEEATAKYQAQFESINKITSLMDDYTSQYADLVSKAVDLAQDQVDSEEEYKLKELEKQYSEGLITEEEYNKEKENIENEAAEKTYKLNMWNWSAQCLQAVASGALAVVNALSTAGNIYAGIAMAAVATAMTGVQLGALMAAKPIKPNFATGGIVPGTSYSGDNVQANVNSGEMILNAQQQAQLWKMANGSSGSGSVLNMPISITNEVSDSARVDVEQELNSIKIMVRKQVQDDIGNGLYNSQLIKAQSSYKGVRITN